MSVKTRKRGRKGEGGGRGAGRHNHGGIDTSVSSAPNIRHKRNFLAGTMLALGVLFVVLVVVAIVMQMI